MSNILTVNPGSTAVKYVLFDEVGEVLEQRVFDRKHENISVDIEREWLGNLPDVSQISIRIVHGAGESGPKVLDNELKAQIKKATQFAPIHNKIALGAVELLEEVLSGVDIIACFDTDFHRTMPSFASTYPINKQLADQLGIKRYGFHGLAVESVLMQLSAKLGNGTLPDNVICVHLGGGCSVTAVKSGESVDTTMGLTPLEGLMMITRSGSIDPGVVEYIADAKGWTAYKVLEILNNESGFYGLTGSKNTLDIIERASKHQEPEKLAFDIFVDRIVKQIFAYYGTLQGCDALVFSGGIGYGNTYLRGQILKKLKIIGITEQNTHVFQADEAQILFNNAKDINT